MLTIEILKGIASSLKSELSAIEYYRWRDLYKDQISSFKNIHSGEDCFIIGNGPSLNQMNLEILNNYYTFGLNKIHLIFDRVDLDLSYHVSVNSHVIDQIGEELKRNIFNCPSFISYTASRNIEDGNDNVIKIFTNGRWSFYKDLTRKICEGYTVTYVAIQIAFYMGFNRVFLIGVDHNFNQQGEPNEEQFMDEDDLNHFHPEYFKGNKWQLADLEGSEASFALARHQFHAHKRQILDATVGGKLNIFKKISFDKAIEFAKVK